MPISRPLRSIAALSCRVPRRLYSAVVPKTDKVWDNADDAIRGVKSGNTLLGGGPGALFTRSHDHSPNTFASRAKNALIPSSSHFETLVKKGVFVDKSHAILDFLQLDVPVHLLLRPRRSGKTVLLSMFRDFFECTHPENEAERKTLFTSNNLAIAKDPMFEQEFGKYPVVYLNFSNLGSSTMEEMLQKFKDDVADMFCDVCDPHELSHNKRRKFFQAVVDQKLRDSQWSVVLYKLTKLLYERHKKKVIVLVDEYDTPISYAVQFGYYPQANKFFRNVFSRLLKNNEYIRGAMLVGILRVSKAGWLSGVNNLEVFPLDETYRYATACMFTEDETRRLYDQQNKIRKLDFTFDDLESWYKGYYTLNNTKLFNPWSVGCSLTNGELRSWWCKSGYDETIQERIIQLLGTDDQFRADCQTLLEGGEIQIVVQNQMAYASIPNISKEGLWTFMYYAGYLTSTTKVKSERISVQIPNSEIRTEFRKWIRTDFENRLNPLLRAPSVKLFNDMVNGNFSKFAESFGKFVLNTVPQRILGDVEKVYQDYLHAYFSSAADAMKVTPKWEVDLEIAAGSGRADLIFHRKEKGVIIELKRIPHKKKKGYRDVEQRYLSRAANSALGQSDTRHYRARMPDVKTVHEYGIAFLGPYCAVEARTLNIGSDGLGWVTEGIGYTAEKDEERRQKMYCLQLSK